MSETIHIKAEHIGVTNGRNQLSVVATMTIQQMSDAVRSIAAVMPGEEWKKLMAEINREEVCENCGVALPEGCGGFFRKDGKACLLNREK